MKKLHMLPLVCVLVAANVMAESQPVGKEVRQTRESKEKTSYVIGMQTGRNLRMGGMEIDVEQMIAGLRDGLDNKSTISDDEARKIMTNAMNDARRKTRVAAEDNRMRSAKFLQENRIRPGVVVLPTGVQYEVIKQGTGAKPMDVDTVVVSYRGTLINGQVFDKSEDGKPVAFKQAGLIAGWRDALKEMTVGSQWKLYVPPERAYGEQGAGAIGPNEVLIFEMELVAVKPSK
ncbi:FKBP-type peptidyl-prolyl cis-trans isomerase [Dechloromonas sp. HYN0024]|uniref:FKBP-type peptidyl-prolyl cis-trans isomerase n=1 Tax=Dechloromonas sp. HYN0024 TaxID=2231055 RepID=UPI000E4376B1|nr:FKBP-type peptidyl-prolyl cis-trans isomerase [Dechloromonas sp. HYN0024]AXS81035.1 FKBP-type peptidyl-prolyl cis-trans isomerase [Dechloromonas sp. HYN0024]